MPDSSDNLSAHSAVKAAFGKYPHVDVGSAVPSLDEGDNELTRREFVTPSELSQITGLSMSTVRRYLADGRLPKFQPGGCGGRVLIPTRALGALASASHPHPFSNEQQSRDAAAETEAPKLPGPTPKWRSRRD